MSVHTSPCWLADDLQGHILIREYIQNNIALVCVHELKLHHLRQLQNELNICHTKQT